MLVGVRFTPPRRGGRHSLTPVTSHRCASLIVFVVAGVAHAQPCHLPGTAAEEGDELRATSALETAEYEQGEARGTYQGLHLGFAYRDTWFRLGSAIAVYRLRDRTARRLGFGDLGLNAQVEVWHMAPALLVGIGIDATVPTAANGLGMDHVMLMPAAFAEYRSRDYFGTMQLGYRYALSGASDDHSHHHSHHGPALPPVVHPMGSRELGGSLSAGYRFSAFAARVGGSYAVDLASGRTRERAGVSLGFDVVTSRWRSALDLLQSIAGQPELRQVFVTLERRW